MRKIENLNIDSLESEQHSLLAINWAGCKTWVEPPVNCCTSFTPLSPPPPPPSVHPLLQISGCISPVCSCPPPPPPSVHPILQISGCITFLPLDSSSAQPGVTFPPSNWLHLTYLLRRLSHLRHLISGFACYPRIGLSVHCSTVLKHLSCCPTSMC